MLNYLKIILFLSFSLLTAQTEKVEKVYFEFDKYDLGNKQRQSILDFIKKIDTTALESIQIYGYCDDRGTDDYNYQLSTKRVNTVQNLLVSQGINKNKIIIIEGRGRIILTDNPVESLFELRLKNRRVDLILVNKNNIGKVVYNSFQEKHAVGDRIYLENIYFPIGSSKLSEKSKQELDKITKLLDSNKGIEFEIIGHVCCTPKYFSDAIDRETSERKLSVNRAKSVFHYLMNRNINSLRMSYKGVGNKFPIGKGREFDRRVEFLITKI